MLENEITGTLLNIFLKVHRILGPGLLESVYEEAICCELDKIGMRYKRQIGIRVQYEDSVLDIGFRADLIVEEKVIVELKSIENIAPVHAKTVLTYLRLADKRVGLLVNFNVNLIKDGVRRIVNNF